MSEYSGSVVARILRHYFIDTKAITEAALCIALDYSKERARAIVYYKLLSRRILSSEKSKL